jgi:hypothetical protein
MKQDIIVRLSESRRLLDVSERVLQEIQKCIEDEDPPAALKRAEKKWRNYHGVYTKKFEQSVKNVLADLG